jgi:ATP-binding cassette subfamily B protein
MPYRHLVLVWVVALLTASAATLFFPMAFGKMIDEGLTQASSSDRWFWALVAVAFLLGFAAALRMYFVAMFAERVVADIKKHLFDHLLSLDQSFFEQTRAGELVSRLSTDTEMLRGLVGSTISVAMRSLITLIGSAIMMVVSSPRLAWLSLAIVPLIVLPTAVSGRFVRRAARECQDRVADAHARASETFSAIHTVQSYVREDFERQRFGTAVARSVAAAGHSLRIQSIASAVGLVVIFISIVTIFRAGAHGVVTGGASAGTLGQFVLYALLGTFAFSSLVQVWGDLQRASGGMDRVLDLLGIRSALSTQPGSGTLQAPRGELRFESVMFSYPTRPDVLALDGFDLVVAPGERVALVGPSGAGKSTVFQLLLRFHDPQKGLIAIDGVDVAAVDPGEVRRWIGLVPQAPAIFSGTVRENIRYGRLAASDEDVERSAMTAEAHSFVSLLPDGYDSDLGERGATLSGGQKQRIAIARAVLKDSPILLLDEATSALDAKSERAVQDALERLMSGRTTLVIAHRLATVLKADRIVVMDAGRIVAQGTHSELMSQNGLYASLARLQFDHDLPH